MYNILAEMDSLGTKNVLIREWRIQGDIVEIAEEVQSLMEATNTHVEHTYRETNQLADYIASIAIQRESIQQYRSFSHY